MTDPSSIPLLRTPKRWFTPAEANDALPELVDLIEKLVEGVLRAREVSELVEEAAPEDRWAVSRDLAELQEAARDALSAIEALGVEIKGVQPALLDFPALYGGQEVYICWREGEDTVAFWHPLHTGIRGRRPIDPDSAPSWEYWS